MRIFYGIEDVETAIGTHVGYSEWHTITQKQIDTFADATGDHQWIHVDPVRAADGPFGGTVAHGFLTLSLASMFLWEVYEVRGVSMGLNYGANKVRFPVPVPVDSRVRAGVELVSLTPMSLGFQLAAKITVELEGSAKPACVVESLGILVP